jgi:hypothetical protein
MSYDALPGDNPEREINNFETEDFIRAIEKLEDELYVLPSYDEITIERQEPGGASELPTGLEDIKGLESLLEEFYKLRIKAAPFEIDGTEISLGILETDDGSESAHSKWDVRIKHYIEPQIQGVKRRVVEEIYTVDQAGGRVSADYKEAVFVKNEQGIFIRELSDGMRALINQFLNYDEKSEEETTQLIKEISAKNHQLKEITGIDPRMFTKQRFDTVMGYLNRLGPEHRVRKA